MNCALHTDRPVAAYCRTCGKALCDICKREVMGVIYCESCIAAHVQGTLPTAGPGVVMPPSGQGNPVVAALLGFIPGVGAMYNGQAIKAAAHLGIFIFFVYAADHVHELFGWCVAFWLFYMVFDAYKTAQARQMGLPLPDHLGLNALFAPGGDATSSTVPTAVPGSPSPASIPPASPGSGAADGGVPTLAIVLIALGVLFLLKNFGIFMFHFSRLMWPIFLIALGGWLMYRRSISPR